MATPIAAAILMDGDKKVEEKKIALAAGAEVRKSMLQIARKSLLEKARVSKMSIHAREIDDEPQSEKDDDGDIEDYENENDEGASDDVSSEGKELSTNVLSPAEEHQDLLPLEGEGPKFNEIFKLHLTGFFKGLLNRLSVLMQLPRAFEIGESHIDLENIPEEKKNLQAKKTKLAAAKLINYTLPHPIKISKFGMEATWLQDILRKALHEVVEFDIAKEKSLSEYIQNVKDLKWSSEVSKYNMRMEEAMHVATRREWEHNLIKHRKELRDEQRERRRQYEYKAELALAAGDLARRGREVKLRELHANMNEVKPNLEREKLVHKAVMDYMGKQNMLLREEIANLNDAIENDNQCMDWAIERIEIQIKMNKQQISDIQPKYDVEMNAIAKAEAEAKRKEEEWYANLGYSELSLKSAYKIQKIWRGYLVRRIYGKILRKLRKKRLATKKKGKKK